MQCLCFRTEWQGKHSSRVYLKNTRTSYHARTTQNKVKRARRNNNTYKQERQNTRTFRILTGPSRDETLARNREYLTGHYNTKCKTIPDSRRTDKRQNSSPKLRTFTTHTMHIIFKGNKTSLYHLKQLKFNVVETRDKNKMAFRLETLSNCVETGRSLTNQRTRSTHVTKTHDRTGQS